MSEGVNPSTGPARSAPFPNHDCQKPARTGLMGLEPTTSAVTVRRSNQAELQPLDPLLGSLGVFGASGAWGQRLAPHAPDAPAPPSTHASYHTPTGIRTPVAALRTQNPRPLDDGGVAPFQAQAQRPEAVRPSLPSATHSYERGHTFLQAGNRVRTGDLHVGNVTLYQLSYSRGTSERVAE
jgi:hypothetical protein